MPQAKGVKKGLFRSRSVGEEPLGNGPIFNWEWRRNCWYSTNKRCQIFNGGRRRRKRRGCTTMQRGGCGARKLSRPVVALLETSGSRCLACPLFGGFAGIPHRCGGGDSMRMNGAAGWGRLTFASSSSRSTLPRHKGDERSSEAVWLGPLVVGRRSASVRRCARGGVRGDLGRWCEKRGKRGVSLISSVGRCLSVALNALCLSS